MQKQYIISKQLAGSHMCLHVVCKQEQCTKNKKIQLDYCILRIVGVLKTDAGCFPWSVTDTYVPDNLIHSRTFNWWLKIQGISVRTKQWSQKPESYDRNYHRWKWWQFWTAPKKILTWTHLIRWCTLYMSAASLTFKPLSPLFQQQQPGSHAMIHKALQENNTTSQPENPLSSGPRQALLMLPYGKCLHSRNNSRSKW